MGITAHVSPVTIYNLDKARHAGGKLGRKLSRIGSRREQLAALGVNEMAQVMERTTRTQVNADGRYKQVYARLTDADHERFQRLKGSRTTNNFISSLLNAHEGSTVAAMTNEAANMLRNVQAKMGNATQLDAMRRLVDTHDHAPARASELRKAHEDVDRLVKENARLTTELLTTQIERDEMIVDVSRLNNEVSKLAQDRIFLQEELDATQAKVPANTVTTVVATNTDEASNILFEFVESFAGTTMRATAEGNVVVDAPQRGLFAIIPLWARAVKALNLGKQEA